MNDLHHAQLCARLQRHHADIGGPTSLARFLTVAAPTIAPLLANGVRWAWIAPRIDAVRASSEQVIPSDLPDATGSRVHLMRTTYSRVRKRHLEPARHNLVAPVPIASSVAPSSTERGHDPPRPAGARGRIHSSADRLDNFGNLET